MRLPSLLHRRSIAKFLVLLIAGSFFSLSVSAQSLEGGAATIGTAGAGVALPSVWGHHNPAGWSLVTRPTLALFTSQAYGLPELRLAATAALVPTAIGRIAFSARRFGFEAYQEWHATTGWAGRLRLSRSRVLHVGLGFRYYHLAIPGYGRAQALGFSAGLLYALTPFLEMGVAAHNVNRPSWRPGEPISQTIRVGASYRLPSNLQVLVDLSASTITSLALAGGLSYTPFPAFVLRLGASSYPYRLTAGAGLRVGGFVVDLAAERHPLLGWSPALSIDFSL